MVLVNAMAVTGVRRYDVGNAVLGSEQLHFRLDDLYVLRGYWRGVVFLVFSFLLLSHCRHLYHLVSDLRASVYYAFPSQ